MDNQTSHKNFKHCTRAEIAEFTEMSVHSHSKGFHVAS